MEEILFSKKEFQQRTSRTQELLIKNNLDALLITSDTNYYYYTGHRHHAPWSTFSRPLIVIIPQIGEPISIIHEFLFEDASTSSWFSNIKYYSSLNEFPFEEIAKIIYDTCLNNKRIGAELGYEQRLGISYNDFEKLKENVKKVNFVDASKLIWNIRMIKSPLEIECIKKACDATSKAYHEVWPMIKEGMTEKEVEKMFIGSMLKNGAERPGFVIMTSGKGNYNKISKRPTHRKLKNGDMIWIDLGAKYLGYWSDFSRGGVIGQSLDIQEYYNFVIEEVTKAGLEEIREGIMPSTIVDACNKKMKDFGLSFSFNAGRLGHGIGLLSTEPPHIARYDSTILKKGMTITIEPGIINEYGVFCLEENLVITKDSYNLLSSANKNIYEIL